jgi:hypothetical protein
MGSCQILLYGRHRRPSLAYRKQTGLDENEVGTAKSRLIYCKWLIFPCTPEQLIDKSK